MAVSSSSNFSLNRNQVIDKAARLLNAAGRGVTMSAEMRDDFNISLNAMVKHWSVQGGRVWTTTEATLFPQPGQVTYSAGSGATDHITETYYETEASADFVIGQTVLGVASTTNITTGDNIGIVQDDGTLHWSTVSSKTATTVTIATGLADTAAEENAVFTYTSKIVKPLAVTDARRYDIDSATDTPIILISRKEYRGLPIKTEEGTINEVFYDPQRALGYFNLWRVPAATTELLKFTWRRPIMDFDNPTDDADLPQEWFGCLYFNLAKWCMGEYAVPQDRKQWIIGMADQLYDEIAGFDREAEAITIQPDMDGGY